MFDERHTMRDDAAANGEHGEGAEYGEALHEQWCGPQNECAETAGGGVFLVVQRKAKVIELHDAGHEPIHQHGSTYGHRTQSDYLLHQRRGRHGTQRDHDDLGRQHEVGADGAFHFILLERHHIDGGVGHGLEHFAGLVVVAMQIFVRELLHAFEAEKNSADHHERQDRDRQEGADQQRRRNQNELVDERAFRDCPHHRQLPVDIHAGHLLRIQREVIAHYAGGLRGRHLGEYRNVVEQRRDVVDEGKQTGSGHGYGNEVAVGPAWSGILRTAATAAATIRTWISQIYRNNAG